MKTLRSPAIVNRIQEINCISSTTVPHFRSGKKLKYCFDIDGTICSQDKDHQYHLAEPYEDVVKKINELYDAGHEIIFFTARGSGSGKDWTVLTKGQLNKWGIKFHQLIMNKKPDFDVLIDDKALNAREWREDNCLKKKIGFVASCFDLLHAGHCMMLRDSKTKCDHLIAALQTDPTIDRPSKKNKPIQALDERFFVLESNKYVDEIVIYETEEELLCLIKNIKPDVRILGDEYIDKDYTGKGLEKKAHFHKRSSYNWSTTELRKRVFEAEIEI